MKQKRKRDKRFGVCLTDIFEIKRISKLKKIY